MFYKGTINIHTEFVHYKITVTVLSLYVYKVHCTLHFTTPYHTLPLGGCNKGGRGRYIPTLKSMGTPMY